MEFSDSKSVNLMNCAQRERSTQNQPTSLTVPLRRTRHMLHQSFALPPEIVSAVAGHLMENHNMSIERALVICILVILTVWLATRLL